MKPATAIVVVLLSLISIGHLVRLGFRVPVMVGAIEIPLWVSGGGFVLAGGLAWLLWREGRRP